MKKQIKKVRNFHAKISSPISDEPILIKSKNAHQLELNILSCIKIIKALDSKDLLVMRVLLSLEELAEWCHAHAEEDIIEAADALADRLYVLFGDAVVTGMPVKALFKTVHASNMTKEASKIKGEKAIKGDNFKEPDIKSALKI